MFWGVYANDIEKVKQYNLAFEILSTDQNPEAFCEFIRKHDLTENKELAKYAIAIFSRTDINYIENTDVALKVVALKEYVEDPLILLNLGLIEENIKIQKQKSGIH